MTTRISAAAADAGVAAIGALLNSGTIEIRTGTQPATVATAASGTLLGTLTLSATAGTHSGGVWTANTITGDTSADASGTAGWFRGKSSAAAGVIDGACGTSGSDMNLSTTTIVAGGDIEVTSWTITQGLG